MFDTIGKLSMNNDALSWFYNVLMYNEEVSEYLKSYSNQN